MRLGRMALILALALPLFASDDPEDLVASLRATKDPEELERIIGRIATVGSADGSSTAAVKKYLREESTARLIEIAEDRSLKWSLRGSAMHALRDIGAPRADLTRVAEMALKDPDEFVKSRGEILQNYIATMPEEDETAAIKPTSKVGERMAIASLKEQNLGVSLDQLRASSLAAKPYEVDDLIEAGVDVNAGPAADAPLIRALQACAHQGGENEDIVHTVEELLEGGADLKRVDENKNTPLFTAAQYCDGYIMRTLLEAGADPNVTNGSSMTPLMMALIFNHLDAADALVAKGARLTADQAVTVSHMATSERAKAIVAKASAKKK